MYVRACVCVCECVHVRACMRVCLRMSAVSVSVCDASMHGCV